MALPDVRPSVTTTLRLRAVPCVDRLVTELSDSQTLAVDELLESRNENEPPTNPRPTPIIVTLADPVAAKLPPPTALTNNESTENIRVAV